MIHLTPADYKTMPWSNGKGVTVEMLRVDGEAGLKWRLSRASVVENGPFSIFPGIERNLTVITGPGFDLVGDQRLQARPLVPVAFAGDVAIAAEGVAAPSDDFNVMTARGLPLPEVSVLDDAAQLGAGGTLAIFALAAATVNGQALGRYDLVLTETAAQINGAVIAVRLFG